MIDLHIHILPGVDDGAEDLDETVAMCRLAASSGCRALVATPHQRNNLWWNTDRGQLETLLQRVRDEVGPEPRLHLGGEIRVDGELLKALEGIPDSGLLPLAGSRYLLLEFDRHGLGPDPESVIHEVVIAGWRPIVAHAEFVPQLTREPGRVERLVELGALIQATAMSLTGDFGPATAKFIRKLLDESLVHFVASDAHDTRWRPPGLEKARQVIASRWGEETARRLTSTNPQAVIEDRPLEAALGSS